MKNQRLTFALPSSPKDNSRAVYHLQKIMDASLDMICVFDAAGHFVSVNKAISNILGYQPEEVIGKSYMDFCFEEDLPETGEVENKVRAGIDTTSFENRYKHKKGYLVYLQWSATWDAYERTSFCIARDVSERKALLQKEAFYKQQLHQWQQQLTNELAGKQKEIDHAVITAQEKERTQISMELHDNVNQILTTVKLYNELCLNEDVVKKDLLRKSITYLNICIEELKGISKALSSPAPTLVPLKDAVAKLMADIAEAGKLSITYTTQHVEEKCFKPDVYIALYRIVQEHLTNIMKHAQAANVTVTLQADDHLRLFIEDDGVGFNLQKKRSGMGINNMISRAEVLNGHIVIDAAPGKGCRLSVTFPLSKPL